MNYEIKTVYQQQDLEGFYNAFWIGQRYLNAEKKIRQIVCNVLAFIIMGFMCFRFTYPIVKNVNESVRIILALLPTLLVLLVVGLTIMIAGNRKFGGKKSWEHYSLKGEEIVYHFYSDKFTEKLPHTEATSDYASIKRIAEDNDRFYLFTSPHTAHILPKRDLGESVDSFRTDIAKATNLEIEIVK